jgi:hypothetical protein
MIKMKNKLLKQYDDICNRIGKEGIMIESLKSIIIVVTGSNNDRILIHHIKTMENLAILIRVDKNGITRWYPKWIYDKEIAPVKETLKQEPEEEIDDFLDKFKGGKTE